MAKPITENYDSHSKEDLLAEVTSRQKSGSKLAVTSASPKADIVAALESDDAGGTTGHPTPVIRSAPATRELSATLPRPEDYKGEYVKNDDGETYGLAIIENDPLGRTHKLQNDVHFWEGTKDEFKQQFEKK